MGISSAVRKAFRLLFSFNDEKESFRIPKLLGVCLGVVVFLELLASFVSTSYGLDSRHHLNWISQFVKLISDGVFIPRWAPDGFFGFGAATFYFYTPLTFYIAAIVSAITSITSAAILFQAVSLLATVASFFAARAFLRSIGSQKYQATLGAIVYTYAPFRIVELYHRGALPTHLAYVFIPLVWLGLVAIVRKDGSAAGTSRMGRIIFLGVSSALLALTSVPVTLVTIICIGVAALVVWRKINLAVLLDCICAAGLAAALSAFHFSAVISAHPFTMVDETIGIFPKTGFSSLLHGINWLYVYHLVFVFVPPMLIGFAYWKVRKQGRRGRTDSEIVTAQIGLALLIVILFLNILPLSRIVWNTLLPFQLIQFGFRFYSHLLLFVSVIVGIARSAAMKRAALASLWLIVLGTIPPAILIVLNLHIYPHFTAPPEDSPEYRPIYTVAVDDFRQTMERHAADPLASIENSRSGDIIHLLEKSPSSEKFEVDLNGQQTGDRRKVTFHRFFWPYWHLYSDDSSFTANRREIISHPDSIGRAVAILPDGHYTIRWQLEKTPIELAGLWVSGISWGCLLAMSGISLVRRGVMRKRPKIA